MNTELYMVFLPAISWFLFALGGTTNKLWRRLAMPIVYLLTVYSATHLWLVSTEVALILWIVTILGYGDRTPWWQKCLFGVAYGCVSLPLGFSFWNVATTIAFISLFALSNWKYTAQTFVWKICEGFFGAFIGIQVAYQLL